MAGLEDERMERATMDQDMQGDEEDDDEEEEDDDDIFSEDRNSRRDRGRPDRDERMATDSHFAGPAGDGFRTGGARNDTSSSDATRFKSTHNNGENGRRPSSHSPSAGSGGSNGYALYGENSNYTTSASEALRCPHPGCSKSYARAEHLTRHIRTHEADKPYKCEVCNKGFSRQDVLVRHRKQHTLDPTASTRRVSALQRTKKACQSCSSAKLRCDGASPACGRCATTGKDCVYDSRHHGRNRSSTPGTPGTSGASASASGPNYNMATTSSFFTTFPMPGQNGTPPTPSSQLSNQQLPSTQMLPPSPAGISPSMTSYTSLFPVPSGMPGSQQDHRMLPQQQEQQTTTQQQQQQQQAPTHSFTTSSAAFDNSSSNLPFQTFDPTLASMATPAASTSTRLSITGDPKPFSSILSPSNFTSSTANVLSTPSSLPEMQLDPLFGNSNLDLNTLLFGTFNSESSPGDGQAIAATNTYGYGFGNNVPLESDNYLSSLMQTLEQPHPQLYEPAFDFASLFSDGNAAQPQSQSSAQTPQQQQQQNPPAPAFDNNRNRLLGFSGHSAGWTTRNRPEVQLREAMTGLLQLAEDAEVPKTRVPPLAHGLVTRPSSPNHAEKEADKGDEDAWPTTWNPKKTQDNDGAIEDVEIGDIPEDQRNKQFVPLPSVDETSRLAILELLRFAEFRLETYHLLYVRFARISLNTLNHFLQMYFVHLHPYIPWCHIPTFNPRLISGFLLGSMVALGAQFSPVAGSSAFSHVLGDVVHTAVGNVVSANNSLSRDIQLWQALILWSLLRYSGVRRLMELTEVFRNSYAVALGRMHIFDGTAGIPKEVMDKSQPLEKRWRAWKGWELRKRTGFACFLESAEFTVFLSRPSVVMPKELRMALPCADALWEAPSAAEWASMLDTYPIDDSERRAACDITDYKNYPPEMITTARQSAFASTVLVQLLHVAIWNLRQAGTFSSAITKAILGDMKRCLLAIGGGPNEFIALRPDAKSVSWTAFAILYHQTQISLRVPVSSLLAISGKDSADEAQRSRQELVNWMRANSVLCRELALHAGQCLRLIRESKTEGTYELFSLFFSGLCLHLFALVFEQDGASSTSDGGSSKNMHSGKLIALDCPAPAAMELEWTYLGTESAMVAGFNLSSPTAKTLILHHVIGIFKERKSWRLGMGLAKILNNMIVGSTHTSPAA